MKLLILGGTLFVGRHLVEIALDRGVEVTLFNRGQTNPGVFPEVETLIGDRDGGLNVLVGRRWDAVIDPSGYVPRLVRDSAEFLVDATDHYTFISSISAFADFKQSGKNEDDLVGTLEDETVEAVTGETYGPLKALCEAAVETVFPGRALNVRPGLIVGPYDPTDRFAYWPYRVAQGGEVLAPAPPTSPVQIIDARDLAAWTLDMIAGRQAGVYNATGPVAPLTMGTVLETCRSVTGSQVNFNWVSEAFLLEQEVAPWTELPLWIPESDKEFTGFCQVDVRKAVAAGLAFRPLAQTVADTLAWSHTRGKDYEWRGGLKLERERELLKRYVDTLTR